MTPTKRELRELLALINRIGTKIGDAITAAGKATNDAIADNTKATEKAAEQQPAEPPSRITVDIQIPREEADRYYAQHNNPNSLQWWAFWVNVLAFLAVAVYAAITYRQWRTMDATLKEAQSQTAISRRLAETSDKSYRLEQRAWIVVSTKGPITHTINMPIFYPLRIVNIGKTIAKRMEAHIAVELINRREGPEFIYTPGHAHTMKLANIVLPNDPDDGSYPALKRGATGYAEQVLITPTILRGVNTQTLATMAHGKITYKDIFGADHWINFCFQDTLIQRTRIDAASKKCSDYNDTDQEK